MRARVIDGTDGEEQTLYPLWATKRTIRELLGVCDKVLYLLVADGKVGFVKTGDSRQNAALYNFRDILAWLRGRSAIHKQHTKRKHQDEDNENRDHAHRADARHQER